MKLASVLVDNTPQAARIDTDTMSLELLPYPDLRYLLESGGLSIDKPTARIPLADARIRPVIPHPSKLICVGLNYRSHIAEMNRPTPQYPTLFAKFCSALIGPHDDIHIPEATSAMDWEVELAIVIGAPVGPNRPRNPTDAIAGFTIVNDITARDWQNRTSQWLQGKNFDRTTPLGPWLVTPDETGDAPQLEISCLVNGRVVQQGNTSDLVFSPTELIEYVARFCTLDPGDIIATGTPGGVGAGMTPPVYLRPGDTVVSRIEGIGTLANTCVQHRGRHHGN